MKNTLFKSTVFALAGIGLVAGSVMATPMYTGETYSEVGVGNVPLLPSETGYYIWSNDSAKTSWSVRWTGNGNGTTDDETWVGKIDFINNDNISTEAVLWETSGYYADGTIDHHADQFSEFVTYNGHAGPHWDGFDFTLKSDSSAGYLRFNLGGSFYSGLTVSNTEVAATAMWIGNGNEMDVLVNEWDNGTIYQSFETPAPVPEPATMLLFGAGLIGLAGFSSRRKNK